MEVLGQLVGAVCSGRHAAAGGRAPEREMRKALAVPEVRERIAQIGLRPLGNDAAEFKPYVAEQARRIAEL